MGKISGYSENTSPATGDFLLGETVSGPATNRFKISNLPVSVLQISNPYKFSTYRNAGFSPAGGVIQYDSKNFDPSSMVDIATNKGRVTIIATGFYQLNIISSQSVTTAPQDPAITIRKNGSTNVGYGHFVNMYNGVSAGSANASTLLQLTAGDYLEIVGGGPSLDTADPGRNVFSGFLVCPT